MSRRSRRKAARIRRWEGVVTDLDLDDNTLWTRLIPVDHKGPEVLAEFDRRLLPDARPGSLFWVYVWRRGRKRREVVRLRRLPPLTAEERAEVEATARELAAQLQAISK